MRLAALFVQAGGVYAGSPDVELWPEARDARTYPGPYPVVAHPPCGRWGPLANFRPDRIGQDGGCFAAALAACDAWGGVLEHPAGSRAWPAFGLPRPGGWGWTRGPGATGDATRWAATVDQGTYGHPAPKRTVLLLVTRRPEAPPPLVWAPSGAVGRVMEMPLQIDREATPLPFAALLLDLAWWAAGTGDPAAVEPVTSAGGVCLVCGEPVGPRGRRGPPREFCAGVACRQRRSRQRRAEASYRPYLETNRTGQVRGSE